MGGDARAPDPDESGSEAASGAEVAETAVAPATTYDAIVAADPALVDDLVHPIVAEPLVGGRAFLSLLSRFITELRAAGLPVSMTESIDAVAAVRHVSPADRETFKYALGATLVKNNAHWRAFETVFEVFFSVRRFRAGDGLEIDWDELPVEDGLDDDSDDARRRRPSSAGDAGGSREVLTDDELDVQLFRALLDGDAARLRALARQAVQRYAGMEPGRPVGGTYYVYRTLRNLDLGAMLDRLLHQVQVEAGEPLSPLEIRLERDELEARLAALRKEIETEIRRRLVADRGIEAMARAVRKPLPEDVDFMHASREDLQQLQKSLYPLTRRLAVRLARKRKHGRRGPLDFRNTVRHSLSYGGVPAEPKFRYPRPAKPEIFVIADISGSVAAFARFTLMLVYAISHQFSRVRSFVFIDGLDEVTRYFEGVDDINDALHRVNTEADVVWVDGHSDYGHAFEVFWSRFGREVGPKTTVIILGDARNNYHASQAWMVKEMQHRARHVYWLNPEPKSYWDTGDSIIGEYATYCDGVFECRNLRQLEAFVDHLL